MAVLRCVVRHGAYYDSVTLLRVQQALSARPGIEEAGVVMGTPHNKQLLADRGLLAPEAAAAGPDDLLVVVRAVDAARADAALADLDALFQRRHESTQAGTYRPRTLRGALRTRPDANLALISVPGRYAGDLAQECLQAGLSVFLFSDNVPLDTEVELKRRALEAGLMVMGPDCGTAVLGGVGLGFANAVRRGRVGIVAASGTGLQEVSVLLDRYGAGVSHAVGTGGRDLSAQVGGITFRQAIAALAHDQATGVLVLIAKPPASGVAEAVLAEARRAGKPVVVHFLGIARRGTCGNLTYAPTLRAAAAEAARLAGAGAVPLGPSAGDVPPVRFASSQKYVRGLYGGGTLCCEAVGLLADRVGHPWTNTPLDARFHTDGTGPARGDTLLDLGDDAFTVGRLHPMLDPEPRAQRLLQEARDETVAVVVLDVVLGFGAHPDPSTILAPAVSEARRLAAGAGRELAVVVALCGTERDPQNAAVQAERLARAGALVRWSHEEAVLTVLELLKAAGREVGPAPDAAAPPPGDTPAPPDGPGAGAVAGLPVPARFAALLNQGIIAVNAGLDVFAEAVEAQSCPVVPMDWRPPAGGDERLQRLLQRLR